MQLSKRLRQNLRSNFKVVANNVLISVIVSAYNAEEYIEDAITSILNQSYQNFEILIADDFSSDNTKAIINSFDDPRIKASHNNKNEGKIKTCNKLLKLCQGEIITIHDADDWSAPDRFEKAIKKFNVDPSTAIVASFSNYYDFKKEKIIRVRKCETNFEKLKQKIKTTNAFDGASMLAKKEVYESIGGLRDFFNRIGGEDYDWISRAIENFKISIIPEPLYNVRLTPHSFSRNMNTPMTLISFQIIKYCTQQRKEIGSDGLSDMKNKKALDEYIKTLMGPFELDPSLVFRKNAESSMYNKLYKKAIFCSWNAIKTAPLKLVNYRTLFYVLRKSTFS